MKLEVGEIAAMSRRCRRCPSASRPAGTGLLVVEAWFRNPRRLPENPVEPAARRPGRAIYERFPFSEIRNDPS